MNTGWPWGNSQYEPDETFTEFDPPETPQVEYSSEDDDDCLYGPDGEPLITFRNPVGFALPDKGE